MSEGPCLPIALQRNSPMPSGDASGVVKCLMFWFIIDSCISVGFVSISVVPLFFGIAILVIGYVCIDFRILRRYLYSKRICSLSMNIFNTFS